MRTGASIQRKAFRHPTFCISRIVAGTTGEIQRVVCWWQSPQECIRSARQMMNICPSLLMYTCFMGLPSLLLSVHCLLPVSLLVPCFSKTQVSKTHVFSGVAREVGKPLDCNPTTNLRRYFSTPVRYVPVAKVNLQIGMESSDHKGFRENLHTARGSILPKKLAVSNLQPLMKPQERNKRR